jgi:hypothetical protein
MAIRCRQCKRLPRQIPAIIEAAADAGMTPDTYVQTEDTTFNANTGLFQCEDCIRGIPEEDREKVA